MKPGYWRDERTYVEYGPTPKPPPEPEPLKPKVAAGWALLVAVAVGIIMLIACLALVLAQRVFAWDGEWAWRTVIAAALVGLAAPVGVFLRIVTGYAPPPAPRYADKPPPRVRPPSPHLRERAKLLAVALHHDQRSLRHQNQNFIVTKLGDKIGEHEQVRLQRILRDTYGILEGGDRQQKRLAPGWTPQRIIDGPPCARSP
jgi:hypothetical protein